MKDYQSESKLKAMRDGMSDTASKFNDKNNESKSIMESKSRADIQDDSSIFLKFLLLIRSRSKTCRRNVFSSHKIIY
jgi:hypothetical protein